MLIHYLWLTWLLHLCGWQVRADHELCYQYDKHPQFTPEIACWGDTSGWVTTKQVLVYEKDTAAPLVEYTLRGNNVMVDKDTVVDDGTLYTRPWVKMTWTEVDTSYRSTEYKCWGEVRIGCDGVDTSLPDLGMVPPATDPAMYLCSWPTVGLENFDCTKPGQTDQLFAGKCGQNTAGEKYRWDEQWVPGKTPNIVDANWNKFEKECWCKFSADACKFDRYVTGAQYNEPGGVGDVATDEIAGISLVNPQDYDNAKITIDLSVGINRIVNITMMNTFGIGISFQIEITVCDDTIVCKGAGGVCPVDGVESFVVDPETNGDPEGVAVRTANQMRDAFDHNFMAEPTMPAQIPNYSWLPSDPTPPNGRLSCGLKDLGLYQDCAGTTPIINPYISLGNNHVSDFGHRRVYVTRQVPFVRETFYYVFTTKGGSKACYEMFAEVCGAETISSTRAPDDFGTYQFVSSPDNVSPQIPQTNTFFVSDSAFCGIADYDVVMDDPLNPGQYITSDYGFTFGAGGKQLKLYVNKPTVPFVQTHYIRARGVSGSFGLHPFTFRVCGAETIVSTLSPDPDFGIWDQSTAPDRITDPLGGDVDTFLSSSNPTCPITQYDIVEKTGTGPDVYTVSNTWGYLGGTNGMTLVKYTHTPTSPFVQTHYIRAMTASGIIYYQPYTFRICGAEIITNTNNPGPDFGVYPLEFPAGSEQLPALMNDVTTFFNNDNLLCPIITYEVVYESSPGNFVPSTYGYLVGNQLRIKTTVPTSNAFYQTHYIRATTKAGKSDLQPFKFAICGAETVSSSLSLVEPPVGALDFRAYDLETAGSVQTPALALTNSFLTTSQPECPITTWEVIMKDPLNPTNYITSTNAYLGGTSGYRLKIKTDVPTSPFSQIHYIRATTAAGNTEKQPFHFGICGAENVASGLGYDPDYGIYDQSFVAGTYDEVKFDQGVTPYLNVEDFLIVDNNFCPVTAYEVLMKDSFGAFIPSSHGSLTGFGKRLRIDLTIPTDQFVQTHYLRATTNSGMSSIQPFTFRICGAEIITENVSPTIPRYFKFYAQDGVQTNVRHVVPDFTNSNPLCPIVEWWIEEVDTLGNYITHSTYGEVLPGTGPDSLTGGLYISKTDQQIYQRQMQPFAGYTYYNLSVIAMTKAGKFSRYRLDAKVCGLETFVDLNKYHINVFQRWTSTQIVYTDGFRTTNDTECPIRDQELGVLSNPGSVFIPWANDFNTLSFNSNPIMVNTSTPGLYDLIIRIKTVSDHITLSKIDFQQILIKVCGLEDVTLTLTPVVPEYFFYYNTGDQYPAPAPTSVDTWFANSDVSIHVPPPASNQDCPIVKYEVQQKRYHYYEHDVVQVLGMSPPQLLIRTQQNIKSYFHIKASTAANVVQYQMIHVWVCGAEYVDVLTDLKVIVYDFDPDAPHIYHQLPPMIMSNDPVICPIINYELLVKDQFGNLVPYLPYERRVSVDIPNDQIAISINTYGYDMIYLKAITKGNVHNILPIEVEICGGEQVGLVPQRPQTLKLEYLQYSGKQSIQTVRPHQYLDLVQVDSVNCLINNKLTELKYYDRNTLKPYDNITVTYDGETGQFYVNTTNVTHLDLLLMIKTNNSLAFALPLDITIVKFPEFKFNRPPYFLNPSNVTVNYKINSNNGTYKFLFNLTEQLDDHHLVTWMNISNPRWGKLKLQYDNRTQEPTEYSRIYKLLTYDYETTSLELTIPGNVQNIVNFTGAVYEFKILLEDNYGLVTEKYLFFNLTLDKDWYKEWLRDKGIRDDLRLFREPVGRITHISVFGEVDVEFNQSSTFRPKQFLQHELDNVDQSAIQVYVQPEDNWDQWRSQEVSTLNFTWKLREFNEKKMRIKLNFPDPTAVSPYPKYDKLKIFIADLPSLFDNIQSRRALGHSDYEAVFQKGIQKQMHDTTAARGAVKNIYQTRYYLVFLLAITFFLSLLFRGPYDRVYLMLLELQIMCNFTILHVTLPGNVEISSQIIKPFVSLNFLKELGYDRLSIFGVDHSIQTSEEHLEELGQRLTHGYQSYNLMFNLETVGLFFFLFLLKAFAVSVLWCINKYSKKEETRVKAKKIQSVWWGQIVFDDLLFLCIRCFLEVGIACAVVFEMPYDNTDSSFINWTLALIITLLLCFGVPAVYYLILREIRINPIKAYEGQFKQKFAGHLLGAKIDYNDHEKSKHYFRFIISFFVIRVVFIGTAFSLSKGWLQIIILIVMFSMSSCNIAHMKPMQGRWLNRLAIFNQFSLLVCSYHLISFTDYVDREMHNYMGFSFLITVAIFIIVNLLYMAYELILYLHYMILMYFPEIYVYFQMALKYCGTLCSDLTAWLKYLAAWFKSQWQTIKDMLKEICLWRRPPKPDLDFIDLPPPKPRKMQIALPRPMLTKEVPEDTAIPIDPPRPVTPEEQRIKTLKLVKGVWTQVYIKVSQADKDKGRNFLLNQPPTWGQVNQKIHQNYDQLNKYYNGEKPTQTVNNTRAKDQSQDLSFETPKFRQQEKPIDDTIKVSKLRFRRINEQARPKPLPVDKKLISIQEEPLEDTNSEKAKPEELSMRAISEVDVEEVIPPSPKIQQEPVKMPKKKKKKAKKSLLKQKIEPLLLAGSFIEEVKDVARFHDPALFYRDADKNRNQDVIKVLKGQTDAGDQYDNIQEQNPLFDKQGKWGKLGMNFQEQKVSEKHNSNNN